MKRLQIALVLVTPFFSGCDSGSEIAQVLESAKKGDSEAAIAGTESLPLQSAIRQAAPSLNGKGVAQLWFQLHARTRFEEFRDLHESIVRQRPQETLVTLRSTFPSVRVGTLKQWSGMSGSGLIGGTHNCLLTRDQTRGLYVRRGESLWRLDMETYDLKQVLAVGDQYVGRASDGCELAVKYESGGHRLLRVSDGSEVAIVLGSDPVVATPFASGIVYVLARGSKLVYRPLESSSSPVKFGVDREFVGLESLDDGTKLLAVTSSGQMQVFEGKPTSDWEPGVMPLSARASGTKLSADETRLAVFSALEPGTQSILIWDVQRNQKIATLRHPDLKSYAVGFLPDGRLLAPSKKETLLVFGPTGKIEREVYVGAGMRDIEVLDQNRVALVNRWGDMSVVDLSQAVPRASTPMKSGKLSKLMCRSADGRWVAEYNTRQILVRDEQTEEVLHSIKATAELAKRAGDFVSVALKPDQKQVLAATNRGVVTWALPAAKFHFTPYKLTKPFEYESTTNKVSAVLARSGQYSAVWTVGRHHPQKHILWFVDPKTGETTSTLTLPVWEMQTNCKVLGRDRIVFQYTLDESRGLIDGEGLFIIDLANGKQIHDLVHSAYLDGYAANDDFLVSSGGVSNWSKEKHEIVVWDLATGQRTVTIKDQPSTVFGITSDSQRFLSYGLKRNGAKSPFGENQFWVWDLAAGKILQRYDLGEVSINTRTGVQFDGRCLFFKDKKKVRHQLRYFR